MWCGAPDFARCSTGSICRSSVLTAGRASSVAWCRKLRGFSSVGWRSSTRSARRCSPESAEMPRTSRSRSTHDRKGRMQSPPEPVLRVTSDREAADMGVERDKTIDQLLQAREAFDRRDWAQAFDSLRRADDLSPEDTMALATAALLTGDADEAVRALQAGYQDRIRNSDGLGAVRFALWLGLVLNTRGEMAVGGGWVARAERLLETQPEDIVERGYLLIHEFFQHIGRGDFARAGETAARAVQI